MKKLFTTFILLALLLVACSPQPEKKAPQVNKPKSEREIKKPVPQPAPSPTPTPEPQPTPQPEPEPEPTPVGDYVGNLNTKKLHNLAHAACQGYVGQMNEENKVEFSSEGEANAQGYYACLKC